LRGLKPTTFEDIIAMVALYRPGPMQFIESFIKRKHGEEKITYLHAGLENYCKFSKMNGSLLLYKIYGKQLS
jgi:DNA polymerase-3 subunit alpha